MPNHTVSTNVDTMLRAADNAAIRTAIGLGTTDAPTFAGASFNGSFTGGGGGGQGGIFNEGGSYVLWSSGAVGLSQRGYLGFGTSNNYDGSAAWNVRLYKDDAGTLAQRYVGNTQVFRLYNGTDSTVGAVNPTNFDRASFSFTSGNFRIAAEYSNTGSYTTARGIDFATDGAVRMGILSNGTTVIGAGFKPLRVSASSVAGSSCVAEIGGSGEQTITGRAGGSYGWATGSEALHTNRDTALFRNAAGVIEINNGTLGSFRDLQLRNLFAAGNIGIGTTAPVADLDIADTWNAPAITVTGASGNGTTATITFTTQTTPIQVGATIVVGSINPAGYNGTFVVTASTVTSVSYLNATSAAWVSGGTIERVFTSVKLNVTDTASNAASNLMDLQVGGASKFKVSKTGVVTPSAPSYNLPAVAIGSGGLATNGSNIYLLQSVGEHAVGVTPAGALMIGMSSDALLFRDAAGILAQRNLSTAQQFRLYNTTDAGLTNYSRAQFEFSGGLFYISTANAGTGPALGLGFWVAGGSKWTIPTTGHFLAGVDNTFDIGASGANRPRTGYFGTSVETPMLIGSNLRINSGGLYFSTNSSVMTAPSNGVIRFTDAGQSTFTRLELGAANLGISRGTGSPEGVVTALVGSLYIRTDGGASTTLYVKESSPTPTTGWVAK